MHRKWMLLAIPLALMLVVFLPTSVPTSDAATAVDYLDEGSDTLQSVMAEPVPAAGNLTAGYWYADDYTPYRSAAMTIVGDVVLIIKGNFTLTVPGTGVTVPSGSSLTIYTDVRGSDMGKLSSRVTLSGGTLKNVASIEFSTNTITVTANSTITNYGLIKGASGTGTAIYSAATIGVTLNNNATPFCKGTVTAGGNLINIGAGSLINNYGVIENFGGSNSTGIQLSGSGTIINNNEGGRITYTGWSPMGIYMGSGNTLINDGLIESFLAVNGGSNTVIVNNATGVINGLRSFDPSNAIVIDNNSTGFSVTNHGLITVEYGEGVKLGNSTSGTLDNYGTITAGNSAVFCGSGASSNIINNYNMIECTTGYGVNINGTLNNYGTITSGFTGIYTGASNATVNNFSLIEGSSYGIYLAGTMPLNLLNEGTINGSVVLANGANKVTFKVGSIINGNFDMGTHASAVLNFTGTPDSSLIYSTITGTYANIENGTTTVTIDGAALPPLSAGDELILINIHNTGAASTAPKNPTATFGGYNFQIKIAHNDLVASILAVNHAIALSDNDTGATLGMYDPYTFDPANAGYPPQTPLEVLVTNLGTFAGGTGGLQITLSGTDAASFTLGSGSIAMIAVGGTDTFTVVPVNGLTPGTYTATVTVGVAAGNPNPIASVSFDISFTVEKYNASTIVDSSPSPSYYDETVTLTATVSAVPPGSATPTGNVIFKIDGVTVGTVALNASGVATMTVSGLDIGPRYVVAEYVGDGDYNGSADALTHHVLKAGTTTTLSSDLNPSSVGDLVTFTAAVTSNAPGTGIPSGNVIFYRDGIPMGTAALDALGIAVFSISTLTAGTHQITAVYQESAYYEESTSNIVDQVVIGSTVITGYDYYITATCDAGSTIDPIGVNIVHRGDNVTFKFTAKDGFTITEVRIDKLHLLTKAEIALGQYTFYDVMANHTIEVKTTSGYGGGDPDIEDGTEVGDGDEESTMGADDIRRGDGGFPWWILLLLLAGIFILLFLLWIRGGLFLTVTMGEAVKDASITYRIEKGEDTKHDIKYSNSRGKSRIAAKKGSVVTITMTAKDGRIAEGLPLVVVMENRREYRDLIIRAPVTSAAAAKGASAAS